MGRRRGRRRVGGWLIVLAIAIGAIASQSIQAHGYTNADDFFEELLTTVLSWSWVVVVFLLVRWLFVKNRGQRNPRDQ